MNKREANKLAIQLGISVDLADIGSGMWAHTVRITPAMAEDWLLRNKKNRTPKPGSIRRYASDMENDRWRTSHESIGFYPNGNLGDGQNRLLAIVAYGKPVTILVVLGLTQDAAICIDQGKNRSAQDAANFKGIETERIHLAASKLCKNGFSDFTEGCSNGEQLELLKGFRAALEFCDDNLAKVRGVTTQAPVWAAIMRAYFWYGDNNSALLRLRRFCKILGDGQWGDVEGDNAPFCLREKLLSSEKFFGRAKKVYGFTEYAIRKFMEKKHISRLHTLNEERFPFQSEIELTA